jgi:hypothetical protein
MPEQSPGLKEAVRQMAEARHGDSAMFYAKEILSLIEAHHQIAMIANDPKFPPEVRAQRKALMDIPKQIVRQKALTLFNDYFVPEFKLWLENTNEKPSPP